MEENRTEEIKAQIYEMSGLRLCLYGLIITVININIQGFDIFPDVVGYILVVVGLGKIERYEEKFNLAKRVAYLQIVLAAVNIVKPQNQDISNSGEFLQTTNVSFSAGIFGNNPWLATLLALAGMAAGIAFAYAMCMGMKNILIRTGDEALARVCEDRWKLLLISQIGLAASMLLALVPFPLAMTVAIAFAIFAFIAMILFLLLINHAYRSIDGKEQY
jgi:hypothetical protein